MLGLPKSTEYNKRIPKQKFYDNITISSSLKRVFIDKIDNIYWRNKIATSTINIAPGDEVTEIEVFEIKLNSEDFDESVLTQIDKEIPYHIIFVLNSNDRYQVWTAYKEKVLSGTNAFKVDSYFHTEWINKSEFILKIEGLNIDKVYENFVRQIAGDRLQTEKQESLKESVNRDNQRRELEKQISLLQQRIRKEKQLNKQMRMNIDLKRMKNEMEEIKSGKNENENKRHN